MFKHKKRLVPESAAASALIYLTAYLLFHLTYLTQATALNYIFSYTETVVDFILPPAVALVLLFRFRDGRLGARFADGAVICAAELIYLLPYFYIYNFGLGLDTAEAILLSVLFSLLSLAGTYLYVMLLFGIGVLFVSRGGETKKKHSRSALALDSILCDGGILDFGLRGTGLVFTLSLTSFFVSLVSPVADTVSFFISYADSYGMNEILSIILDFALRVVMLVLTHLLLAKFKNRLASAKDAPDKKEE